MPTDGLLHRLAEHAWKDGDSWRRDRTTAAIVNVLRYDDFDNDDVGDRGGVVETPALVLRAIMEGTTTLGS